jgi:Mn-dependent DtxR family transcriptional regulator
MITDQDTTIAKDMHERHNLLVEFLKMIGVSDNIAYGDAEGIEYHLHPEILKKLEEFVKARKKITTLTNDSGLANKMILGFRRIRILGSDL